MKITDLAIGLDCVTKYTIDGKWYRPTVSDVKGGRVEVQFIDYGNTQMCNSVDLIHTKVNALFTLN